MTLDELKEQKIWCFYETTHLERTAKRPRFRCLQAAA